MHFRHTGGNPGGIPNLSKDPSRGLLRLPHIGTSEDFHGDDASEGRAMFVLLQRLILRSRKDKETNEIELETS